MHSHFLHPIANTMVLSMDTNLSLLSSVFNHLVLPPKVPGAQDADIDAVSYDVLMRLIHATNTAIGLTCDIPWRGAYENLEKSLQACLQLNRGRLERSSLLEHFKALGSDHVLTPYLNEQNAGLIIRREEQYVLHCSMLHSLTLVTYVEMQGE